MYLRTIIAVFIAFILVSCGNKENKPEDKNQNTSEAEKKIEEVKLDQNFYLLYGMNKGENFKFKIFTSNKTTETLKFDSVITQTMDQETEYYFDLTIQDKDNEGNLTIDFLCERIKAKAASSMGEKVEYDSKNPPKDTVLRAQFANQEILVNNTFTARISKIGEILDIFKYDKIVNKFFEKTPKQPNLDEKNYIRESIKEQMLKIIAQQIFKNFTDKPVNKDSSWTKKYPGKISVFEMENIASYKVDKIYTDGDFKYAHINSKLDVKFSGKNEFTDKGINYKFDKPTTKGTGSLIFNLDRKILSKSESTINLEMVVNMKEAVAGGRAGQKIDKVETKNIITLLN